MYPLNLPRTPLLSMHTQEFHCICIPTLTSIPVYKNFPGLVVQNCAPDTLNTKVISTSPVIVAAGVLTAIAFGLRTCKDTIIKETNTIQIMCQG